jgi:hypothetical protein
MRCPVCGAEFCPRTQGQRTCSADCARAKRIAGGRRVGDLTDAMKQKFKHEIVAKLAKDKT